MNVRNAAIVFALVLSASSLVAQPTNLQPLEVSEQVRAQLSRIYEEKASRSQALKKLSTNLVYELRERRQDVQMVGIPRLPAALKMRAEGTVQVDITAEVTPELLSAIRSAGGQIESSFPLHDSIRAWLRFEAIEAVGNRTEVRRIAEATRPVLNRINVSEGDVAHRANIARNLHAITGAGVKVGVISDSVDFLSGLQGSGDLPSVTVLPGQSGNPDTSEGTAMLEIVYDLAPASQLFFATANGGEANFANNIIQLANQGCDIIVDDVGYPSEPIFQDGAVAQAVDQVASQGVLYFSSAANSGNLTSATSGTWEGNFVAGGTIDLGSTTSGTVHNFGSAITNQLTSTQGNTITMQWSDPKAGAINDYDLCALNSSETAVVGCSTIVQDGDDDPLEFLTTPPPANSKLIIINYDGAAAPRFLHLSTNRGRLQFGTSGETSGHSAAAGAFSVAAVNIATADGGAFTGGAANPVETFSSDGPRRVFYNANGSPITPGNFLATGGSLRQKPDIAAADGVATATPGGFNPFFGTSAAAPHAAAIAALMLDAMPSATPTQVRQAFASSALDIMAPGIDRDSGYGLIDAVEAIDALTSGGSGCVPSSTTACVLAGRFKIEVQWTDFQAVTRNAFVASAGTSDTALFFWTNPNNWELLIKGINACSFNNKFWIYFAAATNVGYRVTVTDTQTGAAPKVYTNAVGNLAQATNDIAAFNCP